ncbi:MAG TPA: hypothetical protein VHB47_14220 [Thermoanaerobaculia bacterium]|jgi:hypothetical protein|nr:hypothetical protein [Thermoanaerobaculia bacterium]
MFWSTPEEGSAAGVSGAGALDLGAANEALADRLAERLFNLVARYGTGGDVKEGPQRSRDAEAFMVLHVGLAEASPMKDAALRARFPKTGRDRQVHHLGEYVAEVMDPKGCLVGNGSLRPVVTAPAPEGPPDEVVVLRCRQIGKAIETAADSLEVTGLSVVVEMLLPIAGCGSLLGGEVAALERRSSGELPSGLRGASVGRRHEVRRSK